MLSDLKLKYGIFKGTFISVPKALLNRLSRYVVHRSTNSAKMKNKMMRMFFMGGCLIKIILKSKTLIKKIFYEGNPAISQLYSPWAGLGPGAQSAIGLTGLAGYGPATNFILLPLSYDMNNIQAIEMNEYKKCIYINVRFNKARYCQPPQFAGN